MRHAHARPVRRPTGITLPVALPAALLGALLSAAVLPAAPARAVDPDCGPVVAGAHQVATAAQLQAVGSGGAGTGECGLGATYLQVADITLAGTFTPIGGSTTPIGRFTGTYDGGGHTITGLTVDRTASSTGLFSEIDSSGQVSDLTLAGVDVSGGSTVGALVGTNKGTVRSVRATGTVVGTGTQVGGLVGANVSGGTIATSSFSGTVTATRSGSDVRVGGLVGFHDDLSFITTSTSSGTVTATNAQYVGGLVGWAFAGVADSYSTAAVSGAQDVGGLIGEYDDYSGRPVIRTYSMGSVTGASSAGGLISSAGFGGGTVSASFWDTVTSDQTDSAGGTGVDTAAMTTLATFVTAGWDIAAGWDATRVWGICEAVNGGTPFLTFEYASDPCVATTSDTPAPRPVALACTPSPVQVGATVTCTVTGGDPGIDILWRAAFNPAFAGAGVTLGTDGTGTFTFVVPAAALGQEITVELVAWTAPVSLGVAGGAVPTSVPSGGGPGVPLAPIGGLPVALLAVAALAVGVARRSSITVSTRDERVESLR